MIRARVIGSGSYLLLVRSSTGQQWTSTVVKR